MVLHYLFFTIRYHVAMSGKGQIGSILLESVALRLLAVVQDLKNRLLSATPICFAISLHISFDSRASQCSVRYASQQQTIMPPHNG